ncbi:hypothetical protein [Sabulibacter ruber]|uniref:hypothetical protein n=1 Tax=Sabulibacter ruber TaxID=2811901 RepID=UPI001A9744CA|nr:hypothetical protein [Sabulibacter ruber]
MLNEQKTESNTEDSQTDIDRLFDPLYFKNIDIFPENDWPETLDMFGGNTSLLGNEKYIRDYTMYEYERHYRRKTGGLIEEGSYCGYKEGYILPTDLLYYREKVSDGVIKTINFNDLVVVGMQNYVVDDAYTIYFAIYYRSSSTGDFYSISYHYSGIYLPHECYEAHELEEYLNYYATKEVFTEEEFMNAPKEAKLIYYNTRTFKIDRLFYLENW